MDQRDKQQTSTTLLSVQQACASFSICRTTLYELIRAGRIRSVKIGARGIRIPRAELDRFVREQIEGGSE